LMSKRRLEKASRLTFCGKDAPNAWFKKSNNLTVGFSFGSLYSRFA
jgi:hypothetical protein